MIRHCVLMTWKASATPEQIHGVTSALRDLPALIPEIRGYEFGEDLGEAPDNASLAVIADFDDVAGFRAYRIHPSHQQVLTERIRPILANRTACQFEISS